MTAPTLSPAADILATPKPGEGWRPQDGQPVLVLTGKYHYKRDADNDPRVWVVQTLTFTPSGKQVKLSGGGRWNVRPWGARAGDYTRAEHYFHSYISGSGGGSNTASHCFLFPWEYIAEKDGRPVKTEAEVKAERDIAVATASAIYQAEVERGFVARLRELVAKDIRDGGEFRYADWGSESAHRLAFDYAPKPYTAETKSSVPVVSLTFDDLKFLGGLIDAYRRLADQQASNLRDIGRIVDGDAHFRQRGTDSLKKLLANEKEE